MTTEVHLVHVAANPDGTCNTPECPCHELARSQPSVILERIGEEGIRQPPQFASLATVRAAIAEVLDAGEPVTREVCECGHDREMHDTNDVMGPAGHCKDWDDGCDGFAPQTSRLWTFERIESDTETERRVRFIDAVCRRITQIQRPPHNFDRRLFELLAAVQGDVEEMGRLVQEHQASTATTEQKGS